jgi:hypothetical protein
MAVVIEELEVLAQQQPAPAPAASSDATANAGAIDERELRAALAREAWRAERLAAD